MLFSSIAVSLSPGASDGSANDLLCKSTVQACWSVLMLPRLLLPDCSVLSDPVPGLPQGKHSHDL